MTKARSPAPRNLDGCAAHGQPRQPGQASSTWRRWTRILSRSAHILTMCVLVGGHVFSTPADTLRPWLWATLATGAVLWATDLGQGAGYLREVRGVTVLVKLVLVASVALLWDWRVPLLFVVVVLSGIVSHMPGRYRYWVLGRGPRPDGAPEQHAGRG